MNCSRRYLAVVTALAINCGCQALAQGFINLNFESANVPNIPPGQYGALVPIANGLPGWAGYYGTNQTTQILHNNYTLGSVNISVIGPFFQDFPVLQGGYTAVLQAGNPGVALPASIAQTGLIPGFAQSIQMFIRPLGGNPTSFGVTIDGQEISMFALQTAPNYTVYGGDVSFFANQTRELRISSIPIGQNPFSSIELDAITFSMQPIPEPGTLALAALGVAGVCLARRRMRER